MKTFEKYVADTNRILSSTDWSTLEELAEKLLSAWKENRQIFICGNGGSAANAIHIANDFTYGIAQKYGVGLKVNALSANTSVLSCLANDIGYENVFSHQLHVQAREDDILLVLSGSGNSNNVVKALNAAKEIGMVSSAMLGFDGGAARELADIVIHFDIDDMQVSEDMQMICAHMLMKWLYERRGEIG